MKTEHEANAARRKSRSKTIQGYTQFSTRYDSDTSAIWCWMQPEPRPCLNATLIDELVLLQKQLTNTYKNQHPSGPFAISFLLQNYLISITLAVIWGCLNT